MILVFALVLREVRVSDDSNYDMKRGTNHVVWTDRNLPITSFQIMSDDEMRTAVTARIFHRCNNALGISSLIPYSELSQSQIGMTSIKVIKHLVILGLSVISTVHRCLLHGRYLVRLFVFALQTYPRHVSMFNATNMNVGKASV
jgi:hypothetical protein